MKSLIKNIFVIGGLLVLAGLGYFLFVTERDSELSADATAMRGQSEVEIQAFLRLLADIESIEISTEVFNNEKFQSFENFATPLDQVGSGRDNPFVAP